MASTRTIFEQLYDVAVGDFRPDLTLILDLPIETGLARAAARRGAETRYESLPRDFHDRVRAGFLEIAAARSRALRRDRCYRGHRHDRRGDRATRRASGWEPERMARGKASADASELEKLEWPYDWPPPWRSDRLLGHETAEKTMLAAQQSGRLHHAWLLAGPRGIGKATLAWRFARFLLCGQAAGRPVRRRTGQSRRAGRRARPIAGRCALASRPVPSAAHAQSRHRPHARRDRRRRRARARRLHAHDAGDGRVARRHRRRGRRDEPQQRQCAC